MTAKQKILTGLALLIAAAVVTVTVDRGRFFQRALGSNSFNILVVSACSLRYDRLGVYNKGFKGSPRIDEWARGAYVFTNAVAEKPWQNFNFEAEEHIDRMALAKNGYSPLRDHKNGFHFIIPPLETTAGDDEWFWGEDSILKYGESLAKLKQAMIKKRQRPTYIFTHLKYMHYPYLDTINMGPADWQRLSPTSQKLLSRYRGNPGGFNDQLPVIELLLNNFKLLQDKFGVSGKVLSVAGVISDVQRARRWRTTAGYEDDLLLVRELYDLKMQHFDAMAADVLNLQGNADFQKNTVVIFTGDHGEAFMEHGVLGHSVNVYEEMLRYPLMVKFPDAGGRLMDQQTNHKIMAEITREMLEGKVDHRNFAGEMEKKKADYLLARNCQDDIRAVRFKSEWKLIKNLRTNKSELYNLKQDPAETRNVAEAQPELAWKLEEYLTNHQEDFKRITSREKKSKVCLQAL